MSSLRSDVQKTDEKRRSPRVGVGVRATILVHSTRRVLNVFVRDLSLGGIGISSDHSIEVGDHFSLLLAKPDTKHTHILYQVRHCRPSNDGIFDVGAQQINLQTTTQPNTPDKQEASPSHAKAQTPAPAHA